MSAAGNDGRKALVQAGLEDFWRLGCGFGQVLDPEAPMEATPDFGALAGRLAGEAASDPLIRSRNLPMLQELCETCARCPLATTRTHVVFGNGNPHPLVAVVGEGPGYYEDKQGVAFVGKAGLFLDKWLAAINLGRDTNVYLCNVIKCRPPENRDPLPEEVEACRPYLAQQLKLLNPRAILGLGKFAAQFLLDSAKGIGELRGSFGVYQGIPVICTFHPAAVLRNPALKRPVWEDLKKLGAFVGTKL